MLKTMVTFIAATVLGALGQKVMGTTGIFVGSIAGAVVGWYVARKIVPR